MALPAAPHGREDRLAVTAVDPPGVGQIRNAGLRISFRVGTVTRGAIGSEKRLALLDLAGRGLLRGSRIRKCPHIADDTSDVGRGQNLIASECRHLRRSALRVVRVDAYPDRFED